MVGVGLYVEECVQEIVGRFHEAVVKELGFGAPALKLAAPILLQDLARATRRTTPVTEPWRRAVVLIFSRPEGGIRGLVLEFAVLRQAVWETLAARGHAVPGEERRRFDRLLDEALADAADRWAGLVKLIAPASSRPPLPGPVQAERGRETVGLPSPVPGRRPAPAPVRHAPPPLPSRAGASPSPLGPFPTPPPLPGRG